MDYVYILTSDGELYHHGIKGQKWGVRRFQRKDGSLTLAGKKRYYDTPELNKQKSDMKSARAIYKSSKEAYDNVANRYKYVPTSKNRAAMLEAKAKLTEDKTAYRTAKLKYDTNKEVARIQDKGVEFEKKSKHRLKLEEQYRQLGMTDEQAQAAANNRIRTEKILAASAGLTIAACETYIAVKHRKNKIDGIIKAGETLQRIEKLDTGGKLHDVFYAANTKKDNTRYEKLFGYAMKKQTGHAYMMKLESASDIKVASLDKYRKTFQDLYKNDTDFNKLVRAYVPDIESMGKNKQYDYFNRALANMHNSHASEKFYGKLKAAGYGAIQDINDMKFSGYHAKNPLIVFGNSKGNVMVKSVREITENLDRDSTIELLKATGETVADDFVKKAGPISAAGLTAATVRTYRSDPNDRYDMGHINRR